MDSRLSMVGPMVSTGGEGCRGVCAAIGTLGAVITANATARSKNLHSRRDCPATISARLGEQRQLPLGRFLRHAVGERCRVFAGEAMVGELRARGVATLLAHGAVDALDGEKGERVGADELPHAFEVVRRGKELVAFRRVDAVIIRVR